MRNLEIEEKNKCERQAASLQQLRHEGNRANEKCGLLESANKQLAQQLERTKKRYDATPESLAQVLQLTPESKGQVLRNMRRGVFSTSTLVDASVPPSGIKHGFLYSVVRCLAPLVLKICAIPKFRGGVSDPQGVLSLIASNVRRNNSKRKLFGDNTPTAPTKRRKKVMENPRSPTVTNDMARTPTTPSVGTATTNNTNAKDGTLTLNLV